MPTHSTTALNDYSAWSGRLKDRLEVQNKKRLGSYTGSSELLLRVSTFVNTPPSPPHQSLPGHVDRAVDHPLGAGAVCVQRTLPNPAYSGSSISCIVDKFRIRITVLWLEI